MCLGSSVAERSPEEAGVVSSILTRGTMRLWFNGRTSRCQREDTGSIPVSRSKEKSSTLAVVVFSLLNGNVICPAEL